MTDPAPVAEQLAFVRERVRRAKPKAPDPVANELPVARIAVDLPLPHLDQPFDYLVPESMAASAVPGSRVRVRFAGQELDGFVLERLAESEFAGRLQRVRRVVSAEPVLAPEIARLARLVADRYAGTLADVLRLAVPPRHARVEARPPGQPMPPPDRPSGDEWEPYQAGVAYVTALANGGAPRAVWSALPGGGWPSAVAAAVRATLAGGRGALVVVPDGRDVDRVDAALTSSLGAGRHVALTAELGPAERYRRWLDVRRGVVQAVVGTRAAMFAPVGDLGLVVVWDDGDDLHAEPHAPYPHVREVLCLRAHEQGAGALIGGHAMTAEAAQLVQTGWAKPLTAERAVVRRIAPGVRAVGDDAELARDSAATTARLPSLAWQVAHEGLTRGPVLVQVPRGGYLPGVTCQSCRSTARCPQCQGPLAISSGHAVPACRWCGKPVGRWRCPHCDSTSLRAQVVGARRTAEELGRAFPSVPVRMSGGDHVLADIGAEPALVVATPGAEPEAAEGYAAALLLDGWLMLSRPDLRAAEETLRRWLNAAALVRPAPDHGVVAVLAERSVPVVQALLRWDPATFAARELADRQALGFPPAARVATLTGTRQALEELVASAHLPASAQLLGPVPVDRRNEERTIVRAPRADGLALAAALREARGVRSAHKAADAVRVQIDPLDLS
jgi:primosomal protein N' (replication factor Y)